jgi:hypothetical protein
MGYPNGVKGYKLLYPSTDRFTIENNVQFEETCLHASSEPRVDTVIPLPTPDITDDESTQSSHGLYMSFESDSEDDEHANVEPPHMPMWAYTSLQKKRDLVGNTIDQRRMRSKFEDPPHPLTTTDLVIPIHIYMVVSSNLQNYV